MATNRGILARLTVGLAALVFFTGATSVLAKPPTNNPASAQIPQVTKNRIQSTFLRAPLSFEANQGQTDEQVKFLARGHGYQLFLTSTEAVLVLRKAEGNGQQAIGKPSVRYNPKSEIENPKSSMVRMELVGANPDAAVAGLDQLPGKVNYFIGNDPKKWRTNIPTYKRVEYREVYPGINLLFYGNQRQLEYDFVVSPGADPSVIQLAFEGADKVEIDSQGDVVLRTAAGDLRLHKPLVYQEIAGVRKQISAVFVLNPKSKIGNLKSEVVGFQVAAYDTSRPLVIDPVLTYSTYLGGSGGELVGTAIALDSQGNAYVTGMTTSSNFPTTVGALDISFGGGDSDAFVAKITDVVTVAIIIDEDSIDNGNPPNFFSSMDVNDHIADIGLRAQIPFFAANVGATITLHTGRWGG